MAEQKRGRGRPALTPEEKKQRAELREQGVLPPAKKIDLTDPGDNSRFLAHALAIREQPAINIADPVQVKNRIDWYFEHCFGNDMKPTVSGLCNALKITRSTLFEWKRGTYREDSHQAIVLEAYGIMEELWEHYMQNGKINPVSGIFLGKNNFGYQDKQEYVLTPNQQQISPEDINAIASKYEELPEAD